MPSKFSQPRRLAKAPWEAFLNELARRILELRKVTHSRVEVFLLSDADMHLLERRYMKKEKALVDVLAFPQPKGFPDPQDRSRLLGEVYLNWDLYKGDRERLKFLLVHGVLHLLGYRHERQPDRARMERLERRLCKELPSLK